MYNTVHKIRVNYTTKFRDLKIPLGMEENLPVLEDMFAIFTSMLPATSCYSEEIHLALLVKT